MLTDRANLCDHKSMTSNRWIYPILRGSVSSLARLETEDILRGVREEEIAREAGGPNVGLCSAENNARRGCALNLLLPTIIYSF